MHRPEAWKFVPFPDDIVLKTDNAVPFPDSFVLKTDNFI
jgi:hypothetical protein